MGCRVCITVNGRHFYSLIAFIADGGNCAIVDNTCSFMSVLV